MNNSNIQPDLSDGSITLTGNVLNYIMHNKSFKSVKLSKNQEMLFNCLLNDRVKKEQIITFIWGEGNSKERSYQKLIYRTRTKLIKAGFPRDIILTIPKTGIYLNKKTATPIDKLTYDSVELHGDARIMHAFHM